MSCNLENYLLPEGLKKQLIHGDPKFNNFLFKDGEVRAIIDIDTIMIAPVLIDLGDLMRSWCKINECYFDFHLFEIILNSYLKINKMKSIRKYAAQATKLITLVLACRYLTDAFSDKGEEYFSYDKNNFSSPFEPNIIRAENTIRYFKDMCKYI